MIRLSLIFALLTSNLALANDSFEKEALKFAGTYAVESCSEGSVYGPLEIKVLGAGFSAVAIEIKDRVFPKHIYMISEFGTKKDSFKRKNDWGCTKEQTEVTFQPGVLKTKFSSRFYNFCTVPEAGSKVSIARNYALLDGRLHVTGYHHDSNGKDKVDCVLTRY